MPILHLGAGATRVTGLKYGLRASIPCINTYSTSISGSINYIFICSTAGGGNVKLNEALERSTSRPKGVMWRGHTYLLVKDYPRQGDAPWLIYGIGHHSEHWLPDSISMGDEFLPVMADPKEARQVRNEDLQAFYDSWTEQDEEDCDEF